MRLASYTLLVAPQTRSSNVVRSIHTIFRRSTNTLEECGSLHTYHFLSRHKHARRMWFAPRTPFFGAPQTRSRNVVRSVHATFCRATNTLVKCSSPNTQHFCRATNTLVECGSFIHATFRRATNTFVEYSSPHTYHFSSRNKYVHGKGLYISIRVRPILMINVLRLKHSQSNEYVSNKAVLSNN